MLEGEELFVYVNMSAVGNILAKSYFGRRSPILIAGRLAMSKEKNDIFKKMR